MKIQLKFFRVEYFLKNIFNFLIVKFLDEDLANQPPSAQTALCVLYATQDYYAKICDGDSRHSGAELIGKVENVLREEFQYDLVSFFLNLRK